MFGIGPAARLLLKDFVNLVFLAAFVYLLLGS